MKRPFISESYELIRRKPRYKILYEKKVKELAWSRSNKYSLSIYNRNQGDLDHDHIFNEWELVSEGGIAFCVWKCSCGVEVNQLLGERIPPEKIPKDMIEWSE